MPPRAVSLFHAMCQASPAHKRVKLTPEALAYAEAPGKHTESLASFAAFCTGHKEQLAFLGEATETPFGSLFLQEKAASMYLESLYSSEKKMSLGTLQTHFQSLKKGLRDGGVECPWAAYRASHPEPVRDLQRRLAKDKALDPKTPGAKMEGYLLPEEIQGHCARELAKDALNPLSSSDLSNLLYLRMQAARSHRSSDLMRIVLANVVWSPGMAATPTIDIATIKPLGGKSVGAIAKAKTKITFYIVDVITRTAGQVPLQIPCSTSTHYPQIPSSFFAIPWQFLTGPLQVPHRFLASPWPSSYRFPAGAHPILPKHPQHPPNIPNTTPNILKTSQIH